MSGTTVKQRMGEVQAFIFGLTIYFVVSTICETVRQIHKEHHSPPQELSTGETPK